MDNPIENANYSIPGWQKDLTDFNAEYNTDYDSAIRLSWSYSSDVGYSVLGYHFGYVIDHGRGHAGFRQKARRMFVEEGLETYHPAYPPGITDKFYDKEKHYGSFQIFGIVDGLRVCEHRIYGRTYDTLHTTKLKESTIVQHLGSRLLPEFKEILPFAIERSRMAIEGIYSTCISRNYKSGWVYHKLKDLVSSDNFQKPFLDRFFFADADCICKELWHDFLKKYRPLELEEIWNKRYLP
jgi:hypothetical protein